MLKKSPKPPPPPCWMTGRGAVLLWMLNNTQEAIKMHLHKLKFIYCHVYLLLLCCHKIMPSPPSIVQWFIMSLTQTSRAKCWQKNTHVRHQCDNNQHWEVVKPSFLAKNPSYLKMMPSYLNLMEEWSFKRIDMDMQSYIVKVSLLWASNVKSGETPSLKRINFLIPLLYHANK